jgi:hypothetical protein
MTEDTEGGPRIKTKRDQCRIGTAFRIEWNVWKRKIRRDEKRSSSRPDFKKCANRAEAGEEVVRKKSEIQKRNTMGAMDPNERPSSCVF